MIRHGSYFVKPEYSLQWIFVGSALSLQEFLNNTKYTCEVKYDKDQSYLH